MRRPATDEYFGMPNRTVYYTAASVIAACASQYWIFSKSVEVESEAFGWVLLFFLVMYTKRRRARDKSQELLLQNVVKQKTVTCWMVAAAIAIGSLSYSENKLHGLLLPTLTPLLLLIEGQVTPQIPILNKGQSRRWTRMTMTVCGAVVIALFGVCTLAFFSLPSLLELVLSIVELSALLTVCVSLLPDSGAVSEAVPFADTEADVASLAPRVSGLMITVGVVQTVRDDFVALSPGAFLLGSIARAGTWFLVMETARQLSWTAVPVIKTFAIFATRNPFLQSFETQALAHVLGCCLMLGQLVTLIPKRVSKAGVLWMLLAIPLLPYLANILACHTAYLRAVDFANKHEHPVEKLIKRATVDFENLVLRQSSTYNAAGDEYRRRYKMEPPPGFEKWFNYAKLHDSKIIDDFDVMYESISPLWEYSGQDIRQAVKDVQGNLQSELWLCNLAGQTASVGCVDNRRAHNKDLSDVFERLLRNVNSTLPDVEFLVNPLDEPRVVLPAERQEQPKHKHKPHVKLTDLAHTSIWDPVIAQHCDKSTIGNSTAAVGSFGLPFVQNTSSAKDICQNPSYRQLHGLFISPTSFPLIEGMVPVLSSGSISPMGDVLFPSPAYLAPPFMYDEEHDLDWSQKKNNVYWAGSTTGAFAGDSQWKAFHRQRFVSLAQMLEQKTHSYLADEGGVGRRVTSSFLNSRQFDAAFTHVVQCDKKECLDQSAFFRVKAPAHKDEALQSRLAFDIDGNGISGRWYKLVASKSAPLKQSIIREWHDDRLLPWVHYIPVSLGMEELPELVMYLTSTKKGQRAAEEIANRGREWYFKALRVQDMDVYVYRLLLELARLQDPERLVNTAGHSANTTAHSKSPHI